MDGEQSDFASHEVFQIARAADPGGIRTLGIITKNEPIQQDEEQGVSMGSLNGLRYHQILMAFYSSY